MEKEEKVANNMEETKEYSEEYLEEKLVKKVKALGGRAYKFISPGNSGVPDRLIVLPGNKIGFAEMKRSKGGRISNLQKAQIRFLRSLDCNCEVLSSLNQIDAFIEKLQQSR